MTESKDKPLNIYRASAGSGKTHLLTGFYIKLLFLKDLLPETRQEDMRFGEILAVTFTNKATAEMKGRIIKEIYNLSQEPEASDYWKDLTGLEPVKKGGDPLVNAKKATEIKARAKELLIQILNEYSSFNISTIDSFFQKIVRSFARELNIPGNYEVQLDANSVLDKAVSSFLDKLNNTTDKEIFEWVKDYSANRVEEGANWDFRKDLLTMARSVLTSENYRQHSDAIQQFTSDRAAMRDYIKSLNDTLSEWRKRAKACGDKALQLMKEHGLDVSDLKYGPKGPYPTFENLAAGNDSKPGSRFTDACENIDNLFAKPKEIGQEVKDAFEPLLAECQRLMSDEVYGEYMTAKAIRKNFYQLGIMANIDKEAMEYCNEQNIMLLSSTTELLSKLIGQDTDAPFIYEKTGTKIHSFMIDEFQDTSNMQWSNFKPLVTNALGDGYQNLIVGDVKQSIYRWRGGDWNLLNSGINRFEPEYHHDDTLQTNWRSKKNVIDFNNDFFKDLAAKLDEMLGTEQFITKIYSDVYQYLAPKNKGDDKPKGMVHVGYLKPTDEEGNEKEKPVKEDYLQEAMRQLPRIVVAMQRDYGYKPKDIAVLCRTNDECAMMAEALLKYKQAHPDCPYGMDIISNEALELSARPTIQAIISIMKHLQNPKPEMLQAIAWSNYYMLQGLSNEEALEKYFGMTEEERPFHPELAHRPLYEMTEELIALLPATARKADAVFLQALRDLVLEYASKQSADLPGFLDWWETAGYKKSIMTPEEQNAIQILSIHKSKGLGKPVVILPYASWDLDMTIHTGSVIWCEPKSGKFAKNILLPVPLGKNLEYTIFKEDFERERRCAVIDNLNTAYVAFTRSEDALIIMAPEPKQPKDKKAKQTNLEHWLKKITVTVPNAELNLDDNWGTPGVTSPAHNEAKEGQQEEHDEEVNALPQVTILHDPNKPDVTAKERGTYIHAVLEHVKTADEADAVISNMYKKGEIDPSTISEAEMRECINRMLKDKAIAPYFSNELQVLTEQSLMDKDGHLERADRIVIDKTGTATIIDYKTGSSHEEYDAQLRSYMDILKGMGFTSVKAYLLFLKDCKLVEVKAY